MKKWIIAALTILTVAGCSTNPTDLKPVKDKYTFQALSISLPLTESRMLHAQPPSQEEIEALLKNPNAEIIEFPVVCAGIGETVTNAQTEVYMANVDADVIDGQLTHIEKEAIDLGNTSIFSVHEILEDGSVSCSYTVIHTRLSGTDTYKFAEGIEVEFPHFETRSHGTPMDTFETDEGIDLFEIETRAPARPRTLLSDTWYRMVGLIDEREDGTKMHEIEYIRVLPPR